MKQNRKRRPAKIEFHPLSFGGWGDYEVWAEHGFTPKPKSAPPEAPAEPNTEAAAGTEDAARPDEPADDPAQGAEPTKRIRPVRPDELPERARPAASAGRARPDEVAGRARPATPADPARPGELAEHTQADRLAEPDQRGGPAQRARPGDPARAQRTGSAKHAQPAGSAPPAERTVPARHARAAGPGDLARRAEPAQPAGQYGPETEDPAHDPLGVGEALRPRPYVRGTRVPPPGARHLLLPEVMLTTTGLHRSAGGLDPDLAAICRMCQIPTSVAEVAAYLRRPLDVTRELVLRGIRDGLVVARGADLGAADRPPLDLLHRVHQGLLRLG